MARSLSFELVGRTLVMVQNSQPIDADEFTRFCAAVAEPEHGSVVIWAPKHGPNSAQRAQGRDALAKRSRAPLRVAVVTSSAVARGVVALLNVFIGEQISTFAPHDLDAAFRHAGVEAADADAVKQAIARLRAELGP